MKARQPQASDPSSPPRQQDAALALETGLSLGWIFAALGLLSFSNSASLFFGLAAMAIFGLFFICKETFRLKTPEG